MSIKIRYHADSLENARCKRLRQLIRNQKKLDKYLQLREKASIDELANLLPYLDYYITKRISLLVEIEALDHRHMRSGRNLNCLSIQANPYSKNIGKEIAELYNLINETRTQCYDNQMRELENIIKEFRTGRRDENRNTTKHMWNSQGVDCI